MTARDPTVRNVVLLACCQALAMTGMSLNMTITALVGESLAADKSLATLPLALQFTAVMATTMPASLLMRRIGRSAGFTLGVLIGVSGTLLAAYAIFERSFILFVAAALLIGAFQGFALFYRYAAADTASPAFRARAISLVLAGGVVSAIAGPELAKWTRTLLDPVLFAGSYVVVAGLQALSLPLLALVRIPRPSASETRSSGRPLGEIARQPSFVVAVTGAMIGYGVMALVMTATPLAMVGCGHAFTDAAFVIQWHALAMYAPSFFTGGLIARYGVLNVMLAGAGLMLASVAVNLTGLALLQFLGGLVLLGLGWNFLFVGGTTLLASTHQPDERAKTQGLADFLIFAAVAGGSFTSGALQFRFGWEVVNLGVLPAILLAVGLLFWLKTRTRRAAAA